MRRWFLGLAVAIVVAGVAVADDKAEAVVKKSIEAHGGAGALDKYKAGRCKIKGDLHISGMDLEYSGTIAYSLPDRFRMEVETEVMGQKVTINQIVKGDKVKSSVTVGGMTVPTPETDDEKDELKLAAAMQEAEQLTPLLDKKKFTLKVADDEEVNGKKASVVVVTPAAVKKEVKFFFDKSSGLMVKSAHRGVGPGDDGSPKEVLEESYNSDFKKVKGVMIPMKLEIKHDDKKFMTFNVSDYELLEKIDDKEFTVDD
jgi:outer membrane lipoprotein-sorting protein